jgi:hypothetical protein
MTKTSAGASRNALAEVLMFSGRNPAKIPTGPATAPLIMLNQ